MEAIKYNPIIDYGGWGIKHSYIGKVYNVSGNFGVKNIFVKWQKHFIWK